MTSIERGLVTVTLNILNKYRDDLAKRGISFKAPEVTVWNEDVAVRTSEISVWLYREGDVEDVLEFHVFDQGQQVASEVEVENWMEEQLRQKLQ